MKDYTYSSPGLQDNDDIFKVMGSDVKVTGNIF